MKNPKLPNLCYIAVQVGPDQWTLAMVHNGESGYSMCVGYAPGCHPVVHDQADTRNQMIHVSKKERVCMEVGSMFGWQVPGADPDKYDENGNPICVAKRGAK